MLFLRNKKNLLTKRKQDLWMLNLAVYLYPNYKNAEIVAKQLVCCYFYSSIYSTCAK